MVTCPHDYEAIFINVGQGDATLVHHLTGVRSVLIDAGRCAKSVLPVLSQKGKLQAIFITHWDSDHSGGLPSVIKWLSSQCQRGVSVFINRQLSFSNSSKRLIQALDEADEDGTIVLKGAYIAVFSWMNYRYRAQRGKDR